VPDIHAHISAHETHFTRMRGGMLSLVRGLVMSPFRLWIDGVAGSGKSAVGRYYFDLALEQERQPLFVCFNRPLSERVKRATGKGGYVDTFYGLCASFLEERGQTIDYSQMTNGPNFWLGIQERVVDEPKPDSWLFDTLVVDEGQDFEPIWYDILQSFLRDDAAILWLQDPEQNIRQQEDIVLPSDFVGYRSPINHRSPDTIARFILRNLDVDFECGNDLPGLGVGISTYEESGEQAGIVAEIVRNLLKRGFGYEDIVVVSLRGISTAFFEGLQRIGGYSAKRFTGDYDELGNQVMSDGMLTLETIYRFKGQQAPAVILVDVDPDPTNRLRANRLLNAAMTRATVRLDIVMRSGNEMTKEFEI
jgi:superfamily I DNA and RNA helicase